MDVHEAARLLYAGEAIALDVRERYEWEAGRLGRGVHMPMSELAGQLAALPRDRLIVAVCRSGNRSDIVACALRGAGFRVENLEGGLKAWERAGLPLEPTGARVV